MKPSSLSFWKTLGIYSLPILLSSLIAVLIFRLWNVDLRHPLVSWNAGGDFTSSSYQLKVLVERVWIYFNPMAGAPFGATWYDYPASDLLHSLVVLAVARFVRDPIVIFNIYYLAGFPLTALTAFFALRRLGAAAFLALPAALAYTFLGYHFNQYNKLYITEYYTIPLGILVFVELVHDGSSILKWDPGTHRLVFQHRQVYTWYLLGLTALVSISGVYYSFFIALIGLFAVVRRLFLPAKGRLNAVLSCLLLLGFIAGINALFLTPNMVLQQIYGQPAAQIGQRGWYESEYFGLKLIQMLLPAQGNFLPQFSYLSERYNAAAPLVGENTSSSLGLLASTGFLASLFFVFRPADRNGLLQTLGGLNIYSFLLGTTGGGGVILAYFFLPSIRAYNRLSVVIGFGSLALLCLLIQGGLKRLPAAWQCTGRRTRLVQSMVSLVLLVVMVADQCGFPAYEYYLGQVEGIKTTRRFTATMEQTLPAGAMILQLPFIPFPENGPKNRMFDYDHFKPFLFSTNLRWSYGDTYGRRSSDWNEYTTSLQLSEMLPRLAAAGFSGIYIDCNGYTDNGEKILGELRSILNQEPLVSSDHRLQLFNIQAYAAAYRPGFSEAEWETVTAQALSLDPFVRPLGGCTQMADPNGTPWTSCRSGGELALVDYGTGDFSLEFAVRTVGGEPARLTLDDGAQKMMVEVGADPTRVTLKTARVRQHATVRVRLDTLAETPGGGPALRIEQIQLSVP